MFDWVTKLFNDEKIDRESFVSEQQRLERLEYLKMMENREKIILECKGNYYYKTKQIEESSTIGYRVIHKAYITYNVNVTMGEELESTFISGNVTIGEARTERDSYDIIIKSMEIGAKPFMKKLEQAIIADYKIHLANRDIEKLREMIKHSKPISINLTIETTK